MKVEWINL